MELDVLNRDARVSPGSFTTVSWPLERTYPTLFVPTSAVTTDQQHTFVIRIRNDKAEWVTVQTGQTVNGQIEVFGDLKAGRPGRKNRFRRYSRRRFSACAEFRRRHGEIVSATYRLDRGNFRRFTH